MSRAVKVKPKSGPKARSVPAVLPEGERYAGRLLALDPSSRVVGIACLEAGRVLSCWRVKSTLKSARSRADVLAGYVLKIARDFGPAVVVQESEEAGRRGTSMKGLISLVYAQATLRAVLRADGFAVHTVPASAWTKGRGDKAVRAGQVADHHPRYAEVRRLDDGFDIADAVGVGLWWAARHGS